MTSTAQQSKRRGPTGPAQNQRTAKRDAHLGKLTPAFRSVDELLDYLDRRDSPDDERTA